jgi:hypothetical protein
MSRLTPELVGMLPKRMKVLKATPCKPPEVARIGFFRSHATMNAIRAKRPISKQQAHRERLRAAGDVMVEVYLPGDLVAELDELKSLEGERGRAPIVGRALRLYITATKKELNRA